MDCPVELVPHLPDLLDGLDSLGCDPQRLSGILDRSGVATETVALDLGCGKGALSVALAQRGHTVEGLDGFAPFIDAARSLAERSGVSDRCAFRVGDLRDAPERRAGLVCLVSVGRPWGSLGATVRALASIAAPGGWILIEDSYRAALDPVAGFEEYDSYDATLDEVAGCGLEVVHVERDEPSGPSPDEAALQRAMEDRGRAIVARDPSRESVVREFLDRQQEMALVYERDLPGMIMLLRRRR